MATHNIHDSSHELHSRAKSTGAALADRAADVVGKAGEQIDKVADSATHALSSVTEQGKEAAERVNVVAGNMKTAIDKSVSDQPMATLAMAAALGFVIGAIWKA